ncbi:plasma-membrane proton-efflux P-type ATPase [Batrachochytrium salamandrivorans]|nr:plasma-membrane proton-efflux P-type ATPase [Batrachochytrium salamandrivorans]
MTAASNEVSPEGARKEIKATDDDVHIEVLDPIDAEIEKLLQTEPTKGLSDEDVASRLEQFGKNELVEKRRNRFLKFLSYFGGAISILLEIATIISAITNDWPDFIILSCVLVINACIGYFEEAKAEDALDALKNTLALKCRAYRNSVLVEVDSCLLVPGDVIALRLGDIVPADCRLLGIGVQGEVTEGALQIDQAALTGESLPVLVLILLLVKSLEVVNGARRNFMSVLKQVLVLTIAAIPVGLPTVMSVTMAVGAKQLALKKVIIKRLPAIEELASVSILCSDKTGTLTLNELSFDKPYLAQRGSTNENLAGNKMGRYTDQELLLNALFSSEPGAADPIELAVRNAAQEKVEIFKTRKDKDQHSVPGFKIISFIPFNPNSKYTEATVENLATNEKFRCIKGAPHVILDLCNGHQEALDAVIDFAKRGLRALGVARTIDKDMTQFEMVGMISLLDPPRPDSAQTIKDCIAYGVAVKMITGDQLIIAKEVAYRLGISRAILDAHRLVDTTISEEALIDRCVKADGFAQVIPEHKYRVVELLQKRGYLVGMTGDGVNDAPALKKANVGIAVHGCTDAARSAADIVLLAPGLSTIVDGIVASRAIFQRMRSYSIYRITSTIHFLLFFFITLLVFDFSLPDRLIILIAVLNDAATLVISVDSAKISQKPDKWRLGQLLSLSFILGVLLMGISFAVFFFARSFPDLSPGQIQTIMYLQISSCPHFVIFSTRLPSWFWENRPSWMFLIAVGGTQVFAMLMSIFGIEALQAYAIGWEWGLGVMASSLVLFVFLDAVKVFVIRKWSFELTAKLWPSNSRVSKLHNRQERKIALSRIEENKKKIRKVATIAFVSKVFQEGIKPKL